MKVVVHKFAAHSDDFLACCVLLHQFPLCEIYRQPFTEEDLNDPDTWVIDQGMQFNPELKNFDHHHIKAEICSFTQILDYFYPNSDIRGIMPELRFIEVCDSFGPAGASKLIKTDVESVKLTRSPIVDGILNYFSQFNDCRVQGEILILMRSIGENICSTIENQERLVQIIEDWSSFICPDRDGKPILVLDVTECKGVERKDFDKLPTQYYCKKMKMNPELILTLDSRESEGCRLISVNTNNVKIKPNPYSHFTHASGFLCCFKKYEDFFEIVKNHLDCGGRRG